MTRWQAALTHFGISLCIAAIVAGFLLVAWYPPPYFSAAGAMHLTVLILAVDLVLGPLLTLVVFKSGKPGLKIDLGIIALLQLSALVYGLSVVVSSRPAYLVGAVDRFEMVAASDVHLDPAPAPEYRRTPWLRPRLVAAAMPEDAEARNRLMEESISGKPDLQARPAYYRDYADQADALYAKSLSLAELVRVDPQQLGKVSRWLQDHGALELERVRYLPLVLRERDMVMVLHPDTHQPVGALDITPLWKAATPLQEGPAAGASTKK